MGETITREVRRSGSGISKRWLLGIVAALVVAASVWVFLLVWNWPFKEQAVVKALQDRFARQVEIRSFRLTYFPPGCVATGVSFLHRKRRDLPPLITVETLTVRGSYHGLLTQSVNQVDVAGLHIVIPPKGQNGQEPNVFPLTNSVSGKNLAIGEIVTDNALIEFLPEPPAKEPFRLQVDQLKLDHVGGSAPVAFHALLRNMEPPGEIRSDGQMGPWNENEPSSTPLSGSYTYQDVKLGFFEGIDGTLSSRGKFGGTIGQIDSEGDVDVLDFRVSGSQGGSLSAKFKALVNGTNGDTKLQNVQSNFLRTTLFANGTIAGQSGEHGKTAALVMSAQQARVEDLLRLFAGSVQPSVVGAIELQAKVQLPPGPQTFLRRLRLEGDFGIGGERFTNPVLQAPLNKLLESAQGESTKQQAADSQTALSNLKGHVVLINGTATLSNISFTEPGTLAEISGTYNLIDKSVHLHGTLHTNGNLSDTTSGFKAVVLKAVSPFLKKKTVTVVSFTISGTSSKPVFTLDLARKRKF